MALQTKNRTLALETAPIHDIEPQNEWSDATSAFKAMLHEPEFLRRCQDSNLDISNRRSASFAKTVDTYAREQCENLLKEGLIDEAEASRRLIIACYPFYLHQQVAVSTLKNRGHVNLHPVEKTVYKGVLKDDVVAYNQLVSNYLYTNPDTNLSDIARSTLEASSTYSPLSFADTFSQQSSMLEGARTEAVCCNLLDRIKQMAPFFDYRRGTVAEDKQGIDAITSIDNKSLNVDFKASLDGVESTGNGEYADHKVGKDYAVVTWKVDGKPHTIVRIAPGYDKSDLGDSCRLPEDVAKKQTLHMMSQLQAAYTEVYS